MGCLKPHSRHAETLCVLQKQTPVSREAAFWTLSFTEAKADGFPVTLSIENNMDQVDFPTL